MRLLDLFCGAGGAALGYSDAGFDVTGVDLGQRRGYPFRFIRGDALTVGLDGYDVIHASPPCQRWSQGAKRHGTAGGHPDLVGPIRERLKGRVYVIENIMSAPLVRPIRLCGSMFGLGVYRHRNFESSAPIAPLPHRPHVGTIGDGHHFTVAGHTGGGQGSLQEWSVAMGIDWMTSRELAQAIPPAYTRYIGGELWKALN